MLIHMSRHSIDARRQPRVSDGVLDRAKILVVEDHDETRELVRRTLAAAGHVVSTARDGKEALDQLLDHASPDLIVLDLQMPVMGGGELIEILGCYRRLATIPLVIVSGRQPARAYGRRTRYLRKPFELDALERVVAELLGATSEGLRRPR
jgi:CheY-like chemotaxis protein